MGGPNRSRRLLQLYLGCVCSGVGAALMVVAELGLDPWNVLHQGISQMTGFRVGTCAIVVGLAVLFLWLPLKQRPGLGTLSKVVVTGVVMNLVLEVTPGPRSLIVRWACLLSGTFLFGAGTGCYLGAGFGPGPRDGLMTSLAARGYSIRFIRTAIEVSVLGAGYLMGGTVGVGTLLYALCIGPLVHFFIPLFSPQITRVD